MASPNRSAFFDSKQSTVPVVADAKATYHRDKFGQAWAINLKRNSFVLLLN